MIILATGTGTRLRPITNKIPKALVKISGKPILGYQIESLLKNNVIIQLNKKDNLRYINLDKYKVSWSTLQIQDGYKIPLYTLNAWSFPGLRFISSKKVREIHKINSEVISVCESENYYLSTIQNGSKYIMVWDIKKFKEFCKKYKIQTYEKK